MMMLGWLQRSIPTLNLFQLWSDLILDQDNYYLFTIT